MNKNNKGGRPNAIEKILLERRKIIIKQLREEGYTDAQIARVFNVHQSQITRIG